MPVPVIFSYEKLANSAAAEPHFVKGRCIFCVALSCARNLCFSIHVRYIILFRIYSDCCFFKFHFIFHHFYSASALLAMQTAVMATADLSVRMSVCPSRSGVLSRKMKVRSCGLSIRTIILFSGKVKFIRIFAGESPPVRALK